jgi:hypothetical protein
MEAAVGMASTRNAWARSELSTGRGRANLSGCNSLVAGSAVAVEADLLFLFASFDAGEWKFSWPVAAGPELHP